MDIRGITKRDPIKRFPNLDAVKKRAATKKETQFWNRSGDTRDAVAGLASLSVAASASLFFGGVDLPKAVFPLAWIPTVTAYEIIRTNGRNSEINEAQRIQSTLNIVAGSTPEAKELSSLVQAANIEGDPRLPIFIGIQKDSYEKTKEIIYHYSPEVSNGVKLRK